MACRSSKLDSTFFDQQQHNNPMNTPITAAHKQLWKKLFNLAHAQIFDDFEQSNDPAHQIIAEYESQATAELRAALALGQENCDAVYDELRADNDELRADVVRITARAEKAEADETIALAQWNGTLERAIKAEAEIEEHAAMMRDVMRERDKAEAELTAERARLDWLESRTSTVLFRYSVGGWSISDDAENAQNLLHEYTLHELRAAIDAGIKEGK